MKNLKNISMMGILFLSAVGSVFGAEQELSPAHAEELAAFKTLLGHEDKHDNASDADASRGAAVVEEVVQPVRFAEADRLYNSGRDAFQECDGMRQISASRVASQEKEIRYNAMIDDIGRLITALDKKKLERGPWQEICVEDIAKSLRRYAVIGGIKTEELSSQVDRLNALSKKHYLALSRKKQDTNTCGVRNIFSLSGQMQSIFKDFYC